ncbi:EAL domain-containing protein [Rhodopila sp.]|uniref:EAL domain-containing protein n=1 Tax=Rhodopila sp. TaxID=2480087 RepID=UPI003D11D0F2
MDKSLPAPTDPSGRPSWRRDPGTSIINLLLVSRSREWFTAVRGASIALGGGEVLTCDARNALARLAGTSSHYSHLLVDRNDAEGLLDELAGLVTEVAAPDTDMLVLGSPDSRYPCIRSVPTATSSSVQAALMAASPCRAGPAMGVTELTTALQGAMIENRYQPIVRAADRNPVGLEALARLNHPQRGTLSPDRFVPQIEHAGLAAELTSLVSARAFADLAGPFLARHRPRMSVNFPLDVLLQPAALDLLEAQRIATRLPAERIVIELTESRPVDDFARLGRSLDRLRRLGYHAAIDDVGPAVPRLAPLLDLPFTSLKLDKEMVQQADHPAVHDFLATTIAQAKAHGLTVVAEGVETESIWQRICALGADEVQGFLASRPLPLAAVPIWWDAWLGQSESII